MALTRAKKAEQVEKLAAELTGATTAIVGTFQKLTVSQDFALRTVVRNAGGKYRVVKNKLAARASQGTGVEQALQGLKGVSSLAYSSGDPVALAKALTTWVKENAEFSFKLAIVDGKVSVGHRNPATGFHARTRGAVLEAAVPDQFSGAETGDGVECNRPRPGGGAGSGSGAEEVFRSGRIVAAMHFKICCIVLGCRLDTTETGAAAIGMVQEESREHYRIGLHTRIQQYGEWTWRICSRLKIKLSG